MNKTMISPIVIIAVTATAAFYGLYALVQTGYNISSFVLLTAGLLMGAVFSIIRAVPAADRLLRRRFILPVGWYRKWRFKHRQHNTGCRDGSEHRQNSLHPLIRFMLYSLAGIMIGSYSELALRKERQPPRSLADLAAVRTVIAELTGEPVPAGTDYYRIPVRLLACTAASGAQFSASGAVSLFVPAALVRGTYAGGITRICGQPQPEKTDPLLRCIAVFADALRNPQECRFYVRGMRLAVQGRFGKTGTVFYARPVQPLFLGWNTPLNRLRAFFRFTFMRLLYGWGDAGGLLLALLAADKAFLPQECVEAFRNAGLAHILALSGMHLSLIGTAALQGGRIFGHRKRAVRFSLAAVCLFVWFAGSAPSLNRALGMVFIAAAGEALGLKPPTLSVLCAMLTAHIAFAGADAVTLGFMLSYGACAGIIIFGGACTRLAAGIIPPVIADSVSASIGAQLFTVPVVTAAIGTIAAAGVIASCIAGPLVSVFLLAGLICIPLAIIFPPVVPLLGYGLNGIYRIIFSTAVFFARFPRIAPETSLQCVIFSAAAFSFGLVLTAAAYIRQVSAKNRTFLADMYKL